MKIYSNLNLDPAPAITTSGGASGVPGLGTTTTPSTIRLDETNHNIESDTTEVDSKTAFDINDITSSSSSSKNKDDAGSMPNNRKPKTNVTSPSKRAAAQPVAEEAAHEDDPDAVVDETETEVVKPEVKTKETPEETTTDPEPEPEAKDSAAPLPKNRDYTGLDEEVIKVLKGTNNHHYAKIRPLLDKYIAKAREAVDFKVKVAEYEKALTERGTPPSWFDHPEAYTLTPEYQELSGRYDKINFESQHIKEQLLALKNGQEIRMIRGYDKAGNPVYTAPMKPTNEDEINLTSLLHQYSAADAEMRTKVGGLQATFKQQHTMATQQIDQGLRQHIDKLIPELKPTKEEEQALIGVIPAAFRDHPAITKLAAPMYSIILRQARMLAKMIEEKNTAARVKNDATEAGVNTRVLPKNGNSPAPRNGGGTVKLSNGKRVPADFDFSRDFKNGE